MPRYFFNYYDDGFLSEDQEGTELADKSAAGEEAVRALAGIAADEFSDPGERELKMVVLDARRGWLMEVRIVLSTEVVSG